MSRPARWRSAAGRAIHALQSLDDLYAGWEQDLYELQEKLNDLCARRSGMLEDLEGALNDLAELQIEYDWSIPERLSNATLQEKINTVQDFNFRELKDRARELEKFALEDTLEDAVREASFGHGGFSDKDLCMIENARELDVPKGYGRD